MTSRSKSAIKVAALREAAAGAAGEPWSLNIQIYLNDLADRIEGGTMSKQVPSVDDVKCAIRESYIAGGDWIDLAATRVQSFYVDAAEAAVPRIKAEALAETERVREAARTLGKIVDDQCRDVLDITGASDLIDAGGDGDWAAVWDRLREQVSRGRAAMLRDAADRVESEAGKQ